MYRFIPYAGVKQQEYSQEPLNKYLYCHAGENNPQEVGNVAKGQGVRSDQHPVDNFFYWILAFARMTTQLFFRLVQSFPNEGNRLVVISLFAFALLLGAQTASAVDLLSPFKNLLGGDDSIVLWQEAGSFIKIVDQDWDRKHRKAPRNQHPAAVNPNEIAVVLASIESWDTEGVSNRQVPVFTPESIRQLAPQLTAALDRVDPDQDIVFAVTDNHDELSGLRSTAGRLFMHDGELNIIFGDVLSPARGYDDDTSYYAKPHRAGKRMESLSRSIRVASGPGMHYWEDNGSQRDDWLIIHIGQTVAAYRGTAVQAAAPARAAPAALAAPAPVNSNQMQRWQQREEMARARKQLESSQGGAAQVPVTATPAPVAPAAMPAPVAPRAAAPVVATMQSAPVYSQAPVQTSVQQDVRIEERLTRLKALHDKGLITKDEFDSKRQEILDQL